MRCALRFAPRGGVEHGREGVAFVVALEHGHDRALREGLCQSACRVTTMFCRPGSGRKRGGSESQVLRPMITGAPAGAA
jgi:hypothetical protein